MTEWLARVCARRPWLTIAAWVALVVIGLALNATLLDSATTTELKLTGAAESRRAATLLEERLRGPEPVTEIVIVQSATLTVDDPAFRHKVETVFRNIAALGVDTVAAGQHYYLTNDESLVSDDRGTTIIPLVMAGELEEATERVERVLGVIAAENAAGDDFRVLMSGAASIAHESNELATADLEKGERIGIPVALVILLALFGTVVAAAGSPGAGGSGHHHRPGRGGGHRPGLRAGVLRHPDDYQDWPGRGHRLLANHYLSFPGGTEPGPGRRVEAVARAGDTAGRTALFSGATVVIALIGMFIVPSSFFQSLGWARYWWWSSPWRPR